MSEQTESVIPPLTAQPADEILENVLRALFGRPGTPSPNDATMTVSVGGLLVTGVAISAAAWFDLTATEVSKTAPLAGDLFRGVFERAQRQVDEWTREDDEAGVDRMTYGYLHFKDATIFGGTRRYVGLWRARLVDVDGWTFGSIDGA